MAEEMKSENNRGSRNYSKDFFISYNSADREWAEWIAWQLEKVGYSTILQAWDFRPGANFVLKMQEASTEAERTIVVLSVDYLNAIYTQPEWAAAFKQDPQGANSLLIPVMVHDCKQKLTGLWSQIIYVDVVGLDEKQTRIKILEGINSGRNKPKTPPIFPGAVHHIQAEKPNFPGNATSGALNNDRLKTNLARPKLNKSLNPYEVRDEWIEYITSNLREVVEGENLLDFYVDDASGYRQLRILFDGRTVYSLDIYIGSMGGSRKDEGISFSYAEGRVSFGNGFNATGSFKWNREKETAILELIDMSLLSHAGDTKEYTKEEFLQALWDKIRLAIERLTS